MGSFLSVKRAVIVAILAMAVCGRGVFAATIEVTSTSDVGVDCTLREAIASVNIGSDTDGCINSTNDDFGINDIITFAPELDGVINLLSGSLEINTATSVIIDGDSLNGGITLVGDGESRVFRVAGGYLEVNDMTVTGGDGGISVLSGTVILNNTVVSGNDLSGTNGGGVFATGGSLVTLNNSELVNNSAFNGGGIFAISSSILLNNSSVSNNTASNSAGGILLTNLSNAKNLSIANLNNSTVSGNVAEGFGGGGISVSTSSEINLNNSSVFGNSTNGEGGGIISSGGTAFVNLSNSTVSGNMANTDGGGIRSRSSNVKIINSTVAANFAKAGGGIFVTNGTISLKNSIVANSLGGNDCNNGSALNNVIADSTNIIQDGSCNTDAMAVNPKILPLDDNGGATLTHALSVLSPAIDSGDQNTCTATPINNLDQRGEGRLVGSSCDIGSYEYQKKIEKIIPVIMSILFTERTTLIYENDFSNNTLEGLTVTEEGTADIIVENEELRINPGSTFRDRGVVAIDLTAESSEYMSRLAENKGTLVYSFNIRNMDAGFNNSYRVSLWSSPDTSDPTSFGYRLSGGGFVGDQFRFGASALALSEFGPVSEDIVVDNNGFQPSTQIGAFRIEYTPVFNLWKLYFEASTEVLDPLTITELIGTAVNDRFTNEELKYLALTGQTTGAAYFDNITISVRAD